MSFYHERWVFEGVLFLFSFFFFQGAEFFYSMCRYSFFSRGFYDYVISYVGFGFSRDIIDVI